MNFPNTLSSLRIVLAPVFMVLFLSDDQWKIQVSFIVFTMAAVTDWYDGWYARKYGYKTKWGRFLDPLADKILTSAAILSFYLLDTKEPAYFGHGEIISVGILAVIIIVRDLALTVTRCMKEIRGFEFVTSRLAKIKTFIQMTYIFMFLGLLFIGYTFPSVMPGIKDFLYSPYNYWFFFIIALLTLISGIMYFFETSVQSETEAQ